MKIPVFRDVELDFIDEYVDVLNPVAVALDRLQGQKNESMSFMGALIPTLLTVKQKLTDLTVSPSIRHCLPMALAVLHALNRRFGVFINMQSEANDYIIAALSHPYFKLRWVPAEQVERCRLLFSRTRVEVQSDMRQPPLTAQETLPDDDFFVFSAASSSSGNNNNSDSKLQLEYAHYLEDTDTNLSMLEKYPHVKQVFIRYNTMIPSSGPVERLFSFGGLVHSAKRNRMSDKTFETLLLLKANSTEGFSFK